MSGATENGSGAGPGTRPGTRPGAPLNPDLLAILRCPCPEHAELTLSADRSELTCDHCRRTFAIRDGIPVMLLDEASGGPESTD